MGTHDRLKGDLAAALRDRDRETAGVLRVLIAAVDNAGAVAAGPALGVEGSAEAPRRQVSEEEVQAILRGEAEELRDAIAGYIAHGREDAAEPLRDRLVVVERYLEGSR